MQTENEVFGHVVTVFHTGLEEFRYHAGSILALVSSLWTCAGCDQTCPSLQAPLGGLALLQSGSLGR